MTWDNLKIVLAINRSGSLTGAAHLLEIDQSTVGRRLSAYEADLGTILFVRAKSGFVPTDAGALVIARAKEVEQAMNSLEEDLSGTKEGAAGTVRLMGNTWMLERLAGLALKPFLAKNPLLEIHMASHLPPTRIHGDAAVSLWFEAMPHTTQFTVHLGSVPYAIYQASDLSYDTDDWVIFQDDEADRPVISKRNSKLLGDTGKIRMTATDANILLGAVSDGIGKGLLPTCLAKDNPKLVRVSKGPPDFQRMLYMHLSYDTFENKRIQAVIAWLRDVFDETFDVAPSLSGKPHPKIS